MLGAALGWEGLGYGSKLPFIRLLYGLWATYDPKSTRCIGKASTRLFGAFLFDWQITVGISYTYLHVCYSQYMYVIVYVCILVCYVVVISGML